MAQAARRLTAKDPGEKLAHRRLTVLELAQRLGRVFGDDAKLALRHVRPFFRQFGASHHVRQEA